MNFMNRRSYKQYTSYYLYGLVFLAGIILLKQFYLITKIILILVVIVSVLKICTLWDKEKAAEMDFDHMTGIQFEQFLRRCYENKGYHVTMTKISGDYGADLLLSKKGQQYVVQAKRYSKKVGIRAVQEAIGAREFYHASYAIVVTNNQFTDPAKRLASRSNVILIDGCSINNLINY